MNVFSRSVDDVGVVDCNDLCCSGSGAEHGQYARATADVQDNLIFEKILVVVDKIPVRVCANFVFKHDLMDVLLPLAIHSARDLFQLSSLTV